MIEHKDPAVRAIGEAIADHCAKIESFFKPGMKITLLVRRPGVPAGTQDVVVTNDSLDEAIAALQLRKDSR